MAIPLTDTFLRHVQEVQMKSLNDLHLTQVLTHFCLSLFIIGLVTGCSSGRHALKYPVFAPGLAAGRQVNSIEELTAALEWRWNLDRISLFCEQHEPVSSYGVSGEHLSHDDWHGSLHQAQNKFSRISFVAHVLDGKPKTIEVWATKGGRAWQIERATPEELFAHRLIGLAVE